MIVLKGGDVLTPAGWKTIDVAIERGLVHAVGEGLSGTDEIDARGCLVGPGFVDLHTHLREPGQTWKEDVASGSAAAAAGGFTAVTAMPNTDPPMDTPKVVESVLAIGAGIGLVDVVPSAAITLGRAGAALADFEELYRCGVRLFTDDGDSVADPTVLERAMGEITELPGAFVAQHAEDTALTARGQMHEGAVSRRLGVAGMPAEAEYSVVERDLELARATGARYHCQHVSARTTVELIRAAKESGMAVTAEVTPHHLTFDEESLETLDPDFKMYPPLRSADDRRALREGLQSGVIDAVATDHAPHLPEEKATGLSAAPRGVIGLETAASATWEALGDADRLFASLSMAPARLLGLEDQGAALQEGAPANIVVFDPSRSWTARRFRSKSSNSPYRGRELTGRVVATIHSGEVSYSIGARVE